MHSRMLSNAATLAVLFALNTTGAAFADDVQFRPFKATFSGDAYFTSESTAEFHGSGTATHLGPSTNFGVLAPLVAVETDECEAGWGIRHTNTETLTARNGDTLVLEMRDLACPASTPNTFAGRGFWTVIYGTGRFADAQGWGAVRGGGDFNLGTFEITMIGEINY